MADYEYSSAPCAPIYRAVYQLLSHNTVTSEEEADAIDTLDDLRQRLRPVLAADVPEPEYFKPLDYPRQEIDVIVPDDVLAELLCRTEATFVTLADTEPHWAVITNDMFRANKIEKSKEQFYETGLHNMWQLEWFLKRHDIDLTKLKICFELGSGVGRVTLWLAKQFDQVIATDVSRRMLELADEYIRAQNLNNVRYVTLNRFAQFDALEPFDLFYSSIVLQHNTPPVQRYMLKKILAKLNHGGVALFQVIGAVRHYHFNAREYLNDQVDGPRIEMHPFLHKELFSVAAEQGCRVLEIREEGSCGPTKDMVSNIVMLQKAT